MRFSNHTMFTFTRWHSNACPWLSKKILFAHSSRIPYSTNFPIISQKNLKINKSMSVEFLIRVGLAPSRSKIFSEQNK